MTIQGLQREMAEMRSRDAMYAGLLSATAQHEHEAVTLRGEAHQLREELGAIHGRATHLQSERDSMMLKMERGHEELHRSQAARRELEERVAAMEAEQQQAAARFAALQGGLEEKDATIQQVRTTPVTMAALAFSLLASSRAHPSLTPRVLSAAQRSAASFFFPNSFAASKSAGHQCQGCAGGA